MCTSFTRNFLLQTIVQGLLSWSRWFWRSLPLKLMRLQSPKTVTGRSHKTNYLWSIVERNKLPKKVCCIINLFWHQHGYENTFQGRSQKKLMTEAMSMEDLWPRQSVHGRVLFLGIKSVYNDKSERNYRGKCLGSPVTSYGGAFAMWFCCLAYLYAYEWSLITYKMQRNVMRKMILKHAYCTTSY